MTTHKGQILIGQKENDRDHPIGGEWHIPGGHLEHGEQPEEAVKREMKEETDLDVDVHQIIDATTMSDGEMMGVLFHCEAPTRKAEAQDDLQDVKWVPPSEVKDYVHDEEIERLEERPEQSKFLEKIEKSPF